jgi:hypothetical protein
MKERTSARRTKIRAPFLRRLQLCAYEVSTWSACVHSVTVLDLAGPPVIEIPPLDVASPEGSTVTLQCSLKSRRPRPKTQWFHNGKPVVESDDISITGDYFP